MPSINFTNQSSAIVTEAVGSGSAGRPHTIMGWVKTINGEGRSNNPFIGSFRLTSSFDGSLSEIEGNVGYVTRGIVDNTGRSNVCLSIVNWSNGTVRRINFPDVTAWYFVVLQVASGSNGVVNLKLFADSSDLPKVIDLTYNGYPFMTADTRFFGISGGGGGGASQGVKYNYIRTFVSGTFTDDECRQQALSRTPVSHPTAVLWESWPLTSENYVGEVNGRTFTIYSASAATRPRLDPDQPFVFIRGEATSTLPLTGSVSIISQQSINSFIIR